MMGMLCTCNLRSSDRSDCHLNKHSEMLQFRKNITASVSVCLEIGDRIAIATSVFIRMNPYAYGYELYFSSSSIRHQMRCPCINISNNKPVSRYLLIVNRSLAIGNEPNRFMKARPIDSWFLTIWIARTFPTLYIYISIYLYRCLDTIIIGNSGSSTPICWFGDSSGLGCRHAGNYPLPTNAFWKHGSLF